MDNLPDGWLLAALAVLIAWSALFGGVETALHARTKRYGMPAAEPILHFPINSLIFCNTLARITATVFATLLALDLWLSQGPWLTCIGLTSILLILAEYLPRRVAQSHPELVLLAANKLLRWPLNALYPLPWFLDRVAAVLLKSCGVGHVNPVQLVDVHEHGQPPYHEHPQDYKAEQASLMNGISGLERMSVNDILTPRHEVEGINLDLPLEQILAALQTTKHTRLPVYHDDINAIEGILNVRQYSYLLADPALSKEALVAACYEPYFVPENTSLQLQLLNFHKQQRRLGIVVDEYGDVRGTVALEDIIEEIVGEFENQDLQVNPHISALEDQRYEVAGIASIRELNRSLHWNLPSEGPKTLNGLVTEALESIPDSAVCLKIGPYRLEILEVDDNRATRIMIWQARPEESRPL